MTNEQMIELVSGWSCDERNRAACRNSHGCHCREITVLRAGTFPGNEIHSSDGGSRGLPFDPADAAGVKSGTVTETGKQEGRTGSEVGASQTPGSSMSFGPAKPITAEQAFGPSETPSQPPQGKAWDALLANLREAWSALAMIRETLETLGPVGAVPASEHLEGPTLMHEAEALVHGIQALASSQPPQAWAVGPLTKLAVECHRSKWQFDINDETKISVAEAGTLVRRAFQTLRRIGNMAMQATSQPLYAAPPAAPLVREALEKAARKYFTMLGPNVVMKDSGGIDRVYYAGFSLADLVYALSSPHTESETK